MNDIGMCEMKGVSQVISTSRTLRFIIAAAFVGGIAACDDVPEETKAGLEWLRYSHSLPKETGWKLGLINATSQGGISVDVDLANATKTISLQGLSAMDKGEVARLACPWPNSEFWTLAGHKMTVEIRLKSGDTTLASAVCRRP
jgi:hypothetical protein